MSIEAVTAALQTRHRALTGVTYAPDDLPGDLATDELPAIIVDPLSATTRLMGHGEAHYTERRQYRVKLCAAAIDLNGSYVTGTARTLARTILDRMLADYRSNLDVTATAEIVEMSDTGVLPYPVTENAVVHRGQTYTGAYVTLTIEERYE